MVEHLGVCFSDRHVGDLHRLGGGRLGFEYSPAWLADDRAFPISASLPLAAGLTVGRAAHAFFANLLPEGAVRESVARQLGLSASNDFALLAALGGECAGALSIVPDPYVPRPPGSYERLDPSDIASMAKRFSVLAEVTGRRAPRLSLAGAQDKLPVRRDDDGTFWLPVGGAPSTHILKVPSRDFAHLPANEALVSALARRMSLAAVAVELVELDGVEIAVVERYDRRRSGDATLRLHQEDLCQALGLMPGTKYEQEGGPSFADALGQIRRLSVEPLIDARQLLRWIIFVTLVGNADGHGKNLSILYGSAGPRLAPFYDLVCTRTYPRVDRMLAMSVGGQRDPGLIGRRHWEELADSVKIGRKLVLREVEELGSEIPGAFDRVAERHAELHGESPAIQRIRGVIRKQCRRSLRLLRT